MKRQLYLYLFILSALVTAFTYMYLSKALSFEKKKNEVEMKYIKDSIAKANFLVSDVQKLIPQIKEALLSYNDDPKGNKFVGQEQKADQKFVISEIKILNYRWINADFSDGKYSGEVMLKYFVEKDGKITFQTMDSFINPKQE
jgi:hypothetical protein